MKCKIPEISWHNRDPVLSVDLQTKCSLQDTYRLASGGTDAHVLIWYLRFASVDEDIQLDLAADLSRHQRAVNVVKWSPNGELLASGDDESVIFIWKQKGESEPLNVLEDASEQDKEVWLTLKVLRGHMEDVYDLSWSPSSQWLISGSVDNSAIIWDVHKGKSQAILNEHKGFVQGVAWDPRNQHVATLSTDRTLRIYDVQTKRVVHRVSKGALPVPEEHELHGKRVRYFHDDTLQTFFRRMCYTPDGKLLLTPAGVTDYDGATTVMHAAYVFNRYALRQPAIMLPCPEQYAVALRCCPVLYKLRPHNAATNAPVVTLPYRMIFALATQCSVYFYDTQQRQPFAVISNIHYTRLTDATWSADGRIVVVSSTDGFCSLITFEPGELGEEYEEAQAVLDAVLSGEAACNSASAAKKGRKQKENCVQKAAGDDEKDAVASAVREPLAEKTKELAQKPAATPIAFRRKADVDAAKAAGEAERSATPVDGKTNGMDENVNDKVPGTPKVSRRSSELENDDAKTTATSADSKVATPIAIKRKVNATEKRPATPIAVKRKSDVKTESPVLKQLKIGEKPATPIAFRRKADLKPAPQETVVLESDEEGDNNAQKETTAAADANTSSAKSAAATKDSLAKTSTLIAKALPAAVVLDKEILGSDEKFDSPEKKCRPVTPISVRRHPRTPNSASNTPTGSTNAAPTTLTSYFAKMDANQSPLTAIRQPESKRATPIAVRRTPRALMAAATAAAVKPVQSTIAVVEEAAQDAWPVPLESPPAKTASSKVSPAKPKPSAKTAAAPVIAHCDLTTERTEDMRLVYEDTVEDDSLPLSDNPATPTSDIKTVQHSIVDKAGGTTPNKTPRRVALKTISTPKSKKKLIE